MAGLLSFLSVSRQRPLANGEPRVLHVVLHDSEGPMSVRYEQQRDLYLCCNAQRVLGL